MIYDYVALDVETTGLNPARDKLLEIGAAKVQDGEVLETYNTLVNTGIPVPKKIRELTGITDEMQENGKKIGTAIREFLDFCGEFPVLGHNVQFDYSFLKQAAMNEGAVFERKALDTLTIARRLLPELPSRTLPAMCRHYQVDSRNFHRALDDALAAHKILWKLWAEFGEKDPEAFSLHPLRYSGKKQGPITNSQKGYLNDLLKYHKIETSIRIEDMTKNEASRMIDQIISQYGKIVRRKGWEK